MTSRLASLLVQDGLVAPKQMADAFQRQVLYGGTLDTILLEMNAIEEPALILALGRANALPIGEAIPNLDKLTTAGVLRWFPSELAEKYRAVPLSVDGHVVRVLTTDPADRRSLDGLGLDIGKAIEAMIAPEHRFVHAMSLVYDAQVPARFQSLQARMARRAAAGAAKAQPAQQPAWAPARSVVTDLPIPSNVDHESTPRLTMRELAAPAITPAPAAAPAPVDETSLPLTMAAAVKAIDAAADRDQIFSAMCRGARSRAEFAALFTLQGDTFTGRVALGEAWLPRSNVTAISLPLETPTAFRTAATNLAPFIGRIGEDPATLALVTALGRKGPIPAALVPVILRNRTVAILYADAQGKGLPQATLGELANCAAAAARAFQRLILAAKGGEFRPATDGKLAKLAAAPFATVTDAPTPPTAPPTAPQNAWHSGAKSEAQARVTMPSVISDLPTTRHSVITRSPTDEAALFSSVERGDDQSSVSADRLVELGVRVAELAVARIPGPIRIDRARYRGATPPLADHGPLLALIARFGDEALPALEKRLRDPDAEVRLYVTLALGELGRERYIGLVGTRLFDRDAAVRKVAVEVLLRQADGPDKKSVIESLRGELPGPDAERQHMAADALGYLGDAASVARLIELVKHEHETIRAAAHRALVAITKQDYGTSRWRWRGWWDKHKNEDRTEWLFEGLAHSNDEVRASAAEELRRRFSENFGYHWDAPKRDREDSRKRWLEWYRARR